MNQPSYSKLIKRKEKSLKQADNISEELILNIMTNKKHLLQSADESDRKEVLQEYVEQVVLQPSNDISHYETEITYRVFHGGGELTLLKTLSF